MPSYPIRPTFPIDVRSPTGTVKVGRVGTAVTVDLGSTGAGVLPPSSFQFFAALDNARPGASAIVQAAVPSDPADPINRAYRGTSYVTAGCTLLVFIQSTLSLSDDDVATLLASAANQPN